MSSNARQIRDTAVWVSPACAAINRVDQCVPHADEDTVRDVIHAFNERGSAALDPRWEAVPAA